MCLDMLNHGSSPRSDKASYEEMSDHLIETIVELTDSPVSLIGHSMGGRVAMCSALTKPEIVSSLIVVDVTPNSDIRRPSQGIRIQK